MDQTTCQSGRSRSSLGLGKLKVENWNIINKSNDKVQIVTENAMQCDVIYQGIVRLGLGKVKLKEHKTEVVRRS